MHYKELKYYDVSLSIGDTFDFKGKKYKTHNSKNNACKDCVFEKEGKACPPVGCSEYIFKEYKKPAYLTNRAYIAFNMSDHVYTATVCKASDLINYLTRDKGQTKAIIAVEFVRGSKYFQGQVKMILKASGLTGNKRIMPVTADMRIALTNDFEKLLSK